MPQFVTHAIQICGIAPDDVPQQLDLLNNDEGDGPFLLRLWALSFESRGYLVRQHGEHVYQLRRETAQATHVYYLRLVAILDERTLEWDHHTP